jgi:hypothetical protein
MAAVSSTTTTTTPTTTPTPEGKVSSAARRRQRQKKAVSTNAASSSDAADEESTVSSIASGWQFVWPILQAPWCARTDEAFFFFDTLGDGIAPIEVSSNCPYEVYVDGRYIGEGGFRCVHGQAFIDTWSPETITKGAHITLRVHWINTSRVRVFYRCLFEDPFVAFKSTQLPRWTCRHDTSTIFGAKMSTQLPHQNIVTSPMVWPFQAVASSTPKQTPLKLGIVERNDWELEPMPVFRPRRIRIPLAITEGLPKPSGRPASATSSTSSSSPVVATDGIQVTACHLCTSSLSKNLIC